MSEHPYTIVLTHDIDHISLRNVPFFSRATGSYLMRCVISNFSRLLRKDISVPTYARSFLRALSFPLVKLRMIPDPLQKSLQRILQIEEEYGVRSTFYFIPFPDTPGFVGPGKAAASGRRARYDVKDYRSLLEQMDAKGWEIGIHGLNPHISTEEASKELEVFRNLLPKQTKWGMRMHWLYSSDSLYRNLKEAGYYYDSTFGSNDDVGFLDQRYLPFEQDGMRVLPMNIQDGALLAHWHRNLTMNQAWEEIEQVLAEAREHQAVVTVLWHNASFGAPRYWEPLYRRIIERGKQDDAAFLTAVQAIG